nr:23S ribosomal RNA methyltransferase Erm [Brevibacterium renqingii]
MRPHSSSHSVHGGRHELGQNFLRSSTTIDTIASLTRATSGPIMEIGPGGGAVTNELYRLGRPLTLVELDETRLDHLEDTFPRAEVRHADILTTRFDRPVIVGNLPFHLTTPILRRLLRARRWQQAILLIQWEVARKRAGVGGSTMMTAQWAPWFDFRLVERVPADAFAPKPSVDGGILSIDRCSTSSIPYRDRSDYHRFVHAVFTGRGRGMKGILSRMSITDQRTLQATLDRNDIRGDALPRDLTPDQWTGVYTDLAGDPAPQNARARQHSRTHPKPATATRKQRNSTKGHTMRNDGNAKRNEKDQKKSRGSVLGTDPAVTGDAPAVTGADAAAERPVITGELPIVGAEQAAEKLQASIPGASPKSRSHDKGRLQAERGFMNQHQKPQQPQPRWNLPRR